VKPSLAPGISTIRRITVDRDRTIGFMGDEARVYATPELVRDIEMTCQQYLLEHLDPGENTVGTRIELDHLAPTPLGMWVDITVKVVEVKGRALTIEATARDALDEIARCRHGRFVVDASKSRERIAAKLAKAKAAS